MKITFLSRGNYTDFVLSELSKVRKTDVLVFSPGIIDKLDLMGELSGKSSTFYDLCVLSKSMDCVVICACDTEVYGVLRKSAVLIDCGNLSGVSDMAHIIDGVSIARRRLQDFRHLERKDRADRGRGLVFPRGGADAIGLRERRHHRAFR